MTSRATQAKDKGSCGACALLVMRATGRMLTRSAAPLQGNVESLQTMLSDPESIAPALPLEISFPADQVWA